MDSWAYTIPHPGNEITTTAMYLLLCCLYLSSIDYRSEAVSLTCDDTGTGLTCNCSVSSPELAWRLPGSETIIFDDKADVGSNKTTTNGIFFAVVTTKTGGILESILIYTANESLVNATIECKEQGTDQLWSVSATIADIAGKK